MPTAKSAARLPTGRNAGVDRQLEQSYDNLPAIQIERDPVAFDFFHDCALDVVAGVDDVTIDNRAEVVADLRDAGQLET